MKKAVLYTICLILISGCAQNLSPSSIEDEPNPITLIEVGPTAGYSSVSPGIHNKLTKEDRHQSHLTELEKLHRWVQECLSEGAFHSVHVEYNKVRIEPTLWSLFTIEQKQNVVSRLSSYFTLKGSTGRVIILSSRCDKKMATYGSWRGIRILE